MLCRWSLLSSTSFAIQSSHNKSVHYCKHSREVLYMWFEKSLLKNWSRLQWQAVSCFVFFCHTKEEQESAKTNNFSFSLEILFPSCQNMSKSFPILQLSLNLPSTFFTLTWPWPHIIVKDTIPCRQKAIPWTSYLLKLRIQVSQIKAGIPQGWCSQSSSWCSINNMFLECHEAIFTNGIPAAKALRSQDEYFFLNQTKLNSFPNPPLHAQQLTALTKYKHISVVQWISGPRMRQTLQYLCHNFHHHVTPIATHHTRQKHIGKLTRISSTLLSVLTSTGIRCEVQQETPGRLRKSRKDCRKRSCKCNWKTLPFSYQGYCYVQIYYYALFKNKSTKICQQPSKIRLCSQPYSIYLRQGRTLARGPSLW